MRLLSPRVHGYIDYALVLLLFLAPSLFGFSGTPATLAYLVGAAQLGMSLITAYPLGILKLIPFTVHGAIELSAAVFMILAPWLFGFSELDAARNFFVISGLAVVGVFLVTNYKAAERPNYGEPTLRPST